MLVQEREKWGGSTTRPGAVGPATTFMSSGVSGSHERRSIKFCVHSGLSSGPRESASSLVSTVSPSSSSASSVSVVVPGGWPRRRRLSIRCSASKFWKPPWRACSQYVRYSVERNAIQPVSSQLKRVCCVVMSSHN